jgi:hypothetical protein
MRKASDKVRPLAANTALASALSASSMRAYDRIDGHNCPLSCM